MTGCPRRSLEDVLRRLGSKLEAWQVRALFLGAQASTNIRLGPQHLLGYLFDGEPVLNELVDDHRRGRKAVGRPRRQVSPNRGCRGARGAVIAGDHLVRARHRRRRRRPMEFGEDVQDALAPAC